MPDRASPAEPFLPRRLNRLAFRTAALTALVTALIAPLVTFLSGAWEIAAAAALGIVAGLAAYGAVHFFVARRLELARQTLRQARKRRFDTLGLLRDAADRDELDELLWQVYRAGRTLQQEIERLERIENYRREFLGNVSHELKTPIFVISGFAEQLLDGALEDEAVNRKFVEKIGRNAARLDMLARDLLAISRIESGELKMTMTSFDLAALVDEVAEAIEPVAQGREVTLLQRLPPDLPLVRGDREQLRQVLVNLADNAVKYNNPGGRVELSARQTPEDTVRVAVVDDGIGIPGKAIPRLTERFYRVDSSRSRAQGGTGLGLAIVKHILEAHGQRLQVESRIGYGSSFAFELATGRSAERRVEAETSAHATR